MNRRSLGIDFELLFPALILVVIGLATLFSVNTEFFKSQLFFVIISLFIFFFCSQVSLKVLKFYSTPIYIVSLVVLFIVLLLGIESRGAIRWIEFFGIRIQFSEILKPFLIIPLASYISDNKKSSFGVFLRVFAFLLPVILFIFLQPDLGSAVIYALVTLFTLIAVGFPLFWFFLGLAVSVVLFPIVWHFLHDYQRQRLLTFLQPTKDPLGTSYNAIQAIIAVGSGMFFGKGLGEGTQSLLRFLPERHTDFIFATLSENFGFIGGLLVISVFIFLLHRIYRIFTYSDDPYYKTIALTAFFLLLIQFFINLAMNIGVVPVVGVTLPFVSYGGSSLVSNFILLGFVSSIGRTLKSERVLEIG